MQQQLICRTFPQVQMIDAAPNALGKAGRWVREISSDEGNVTLATLFVLLLTVLYLRQRHRRVGAAAPTPPREPAEPAAVPVPQ